MAKKKLTDVELFYIQNNPDNLTAKEIAKKLDVQVKLVQDNLGLANIGKVAEPEPKQQGPLTNAYWNAVGRRKEGERHAGNVVVMTQSASQISDEAKTSYPSKLSERLKGAIHKPKG